MFESLWEFEGAWRLERTIVHRAGQRATLSGRAVLTRHGSGLLYHEQGMLHLEGQAPVMAERRYLWSAGQARMIEISFEDGGAFHTIDPERPQTHHHCAPDLYEVSYDFDKWPEWQSQWIVTGPRKSYRMTSIYQRLPAE
ncbi:MAG: DUF6314 family protein [Pseudomonadota bacterium]